jgi:hypothetical protein
MMRPIVIVMLFASVANAAEIQTRGPENYPGPNEFSVHLGYQAGFGARFTDSSGFKMFAEYARRLSDLVWFDAQLNNTFGFDYGTHTCIDRFGRPYACGGPGNGWDFQIAAGVKLKIKTPIPLVVEIPLVLAVDILYNRPCGDTGAAVPVFKPGVGVKYFLLRNIGIGGGFNTGFGPAFHQDSNCALSYTDFYGAFDFQVGAEFLF